MIRFSNRNADKELMDDPLLEEQTIKEVLQDVNRANRLLGGTRITLQAIKQLVKEYPQEHYTIMDMGCGDGSMLREVAAFCKENHINARFIGLDLNENSIKIGRKQAAEYPQIQYLKQDILQIEPEKLSCDILLCTLTIHHFGNNQIPIFLKKFAGLTKIGVVINDLDRNKIAYFLFKIYSALFIKTKIARHDGLISVKSGFTKKDLLIFSKTLPQLHHSIQWRWAFRYRWIMKHPK
jgi:ubiquinone/menaquinone biosynthesis C-methylase UbiE